MNTTVTFALSTGLSVGFIAGWLAASAASAKNVERLAAAKAETIVIEREDRERVRAMREAEGELEGWSR